MRILKFGGKALKNSSAVEKAKELVVNAQKEGPTIVVVSAFEGVTDMLRDAASKVLFSYNRTLDLLNEIRKRHLRFIDQLIPAARRSSLAAEVQVLLNDLEDVLHGVHLVRECSPGSLDLILSYGEQLSGHILVYYFNISGVKSRLVDTRGLVRTYGPPGKPVVHIPDTYRCIQKEMPASNDLCVITGNIASNRDGVVTTLGRRGSDFTATLFGAALGAAAVDIWTDRDGIYPVDPGLIPETRLIERMSYEEAQEMAYFGADFIHPHSLQPAAEKNVPVRLRNIFNPQHPGTLITRGDGTFDKPVRGISSIDDVALVNLEGSGMMGVPGIAGRLFTALADSGVNIIMISQASSEHSICFVVRGGEIKNAVDVARKTFEPELNAGLIQRVEQLDDLVVLSIIGSKMRGTVGISSRFFGALGKQNVNILAISQGSSERNISIVISRKDKRKALQSVHSAFILDMDPTTPQVP